MAKGSCPFHAKAGGAAATHSAGASAAPHSSHPSSSSHPPHPPAFSLQDELAFFQEATPDAHSLRERTAACARALAAGEPAPLTSDELGWAARIAWRNHARCIGGKSEGGRPLVASF